MAYEIVLTNTLIVSVGVFQHIGVQEAVNVSVSHYAAAICMARCPHAVPVVSIMSAELLMPLSAKPLILFTGPSLVLH